MNQAVGKTSAIPAELLTAPPRPVRRRSFASSQLAVRLFILPHTLVGIGALILVLGEPLLLLLTPARPAIVNSVISQRARKGGIVWTLNFSYSLDEPPGKPRFTGHEEIRAAEARTIHSGDSLRVHALVMGKYRYAVVSQSFSAYASHRMFLWIWTAFWVGIIGVIQYSLSVEPRLRKRLVEEGHAVTGEIIEKLLVRGKSTTYRIKYRYAADGVTNADQVQQMTVTKKQYNSVQERMSVTILYDSQRPARSTICEFCDFVAVTI